MCSFVEMSGRLGAQKLPGAKYEHRYAIKKERKSKKSEAKAL